jgi:predicted RNase H-like nuclease (RuvC/YqgF family)
MMRQVFLAAGIILAAMGSVSDVDAQVRDDVTRPKSEIENLRKQVSNLEKENELLKREIELMKKEAKAKPEGSRTPGTGAKSRTKATENVGGHEIEYELLKCVRNPKQRTRVSLTFAVRSEPNPRILGRVDNVGVCKKLTLSTADGTELDGKVVGAPRDLVVITKGEWSKFQVVYEGVDTDITEFDEVGLCMGGPYGIARLPIKFHRIKIASK